LQLFKESKDPLRYQSGYIVPAHTAATSIRGRDRAAGVAQAALQVLVKPMVIALECIEARKAG